MSSEPKMLTSARWTSLLFVLACGYVTYARAQAAEDYCYYEDKDPYVQFSTKSAYELIRAKHQPTAIPSCQPVMVWASIRHGTQYPSSKTIEEMKTLLKIRDLIVQNHDIYKRGDLCAKDLDNFKNYSYRLSSSYEFRLSTQGKDDLRFMAKRMQAQFPQVLNTPYSRSRFAIFNDGSERTVESRNAFFDGLFGPDISDSHSNSTLLKSPLDCGAWVKHVLNNSETHREYEAFKQSNTVERMIAEVNFRLGFINNVTLDLGVIYLMYDACRYEKAWYIPSRPPFCAAFTREDLKILEYLEDLKYYYEYSYGNDMNKKLACPLVSDLVQRFNDYTQSGNKTETKPPIGIFYFSQTALHIPLLTILGLKENSEGPLTHSNYEGMNKREFMSSKIDPFSANLAVGLYECTTNEQYRVVFYLNEDVVLFPGCEGGLCPWRTVYEKLKPTVESGSCTFEFCDSAGVKLGSTPLLLSALFAFVIHIRNKVL